MAVPGKHTLLVVDDEPDLVQSVKDLLRHEYRVLGATRPSEGLRIMDEEPVHIIMTDQMMPEMKGIELLTRLKETHPDTVRILFTAYADIPIVAEAINLGSVFRFITKPWEQPELLRVLGQAAEQYDLVAERKALLQEIREKNEQLETANRDLQQANELKKAFIKVASHELRTPLTIVLGMAELAQRSGQGLPGPIPDLLDFIYKAGLRLNDRVDQIIKLLLAERFDRHQSLQEVNPAELVKKAVADVESFVARRKQTLQLDISPEATPFKGDPDKLHDSLVQILINAVKFTPDGGTIRVRVVKTTEGGTEISVTDTGIGIDPASLERIFDPFFTRFDVSRHSSGQFEFERRGLGLGLTVAKTFVEMQGGRLAVQSQPGQGTTFTISLPGQNPKKPPRALISPAPMGEIAFQK